MLGPLALLLAGLILLTAGSDRLVVSAARVSRAWGVSPILIGALVVGLGTSAPEMLVSALAASRGELDLAVGNVVGSNISNVTLVLGATAVFAPLASTMRILRREGVLMFGAVAGLAVVLFDGSFERYEAGCLAFAMIVAAYLLVRWSWADAEDYADADEDVDQIVEGTSRSTWVELVLAVSFLAVTLGGAELLVRGATGVAEELGISSAFVGLVLVAVGTSLPELATAIAAGRHGEPDLVIGNIVGSNLFNSLAVAGLGGLIGPGPVATTFRPAALIMVGAAAVAGYFSVTGNRLVRWEGLVLLGAFAGFVVVTY